MAFDLDHAIQLNRILADRIGWGRRFGQIAHILGFRDRSPGEAELANAIARWQLRHNLREDGVLGPATWRRMEDQTRLSAPGQPRSVSTAPIVIAPATESQTPLSSNRGQVRAALFTSRMRMRFTPWAAGATRASAEDIRQIRALSSILGKLRGAGRAYGRLHATLLFLCETAATRDSSQQLERDRDDLLATPVPVDDGGAGAAAIIDYYATRIEFARAREAGLVVAAGSSWTSLVPRLPAIFGMGWSPDFVQGFDDGFESQRDLLYAEPIRELFAMILVEIATAGIGIAMSAAGNAAGRFGASRLTVRNVASEAAQLVRSIESAELAMPMPANVAQLREILTAGNRIPQGRFRGWLVQFLRQYDLNFDVAILGDLHRAIDIRRGQYVLRIPYRTTAAESGRLGTFVIRVFDSEAQARAFAQQIAARGRGPIQREISLPDVWPAQPPHNNPLIPPPNSGGPGSAVSEIAVVRVDGDYIGLWSNTGPHVDPASGVNFQGGAQQIQLPRGWHGTPVGNPIPIPAVGPSLGRAAPVFPETVPLGGVNPGSR